MATSRPIVPYASRSPPTSPTTPGHVEATHGARNRPISHTTRHNQQDVTMDLEFSAEQEMLREMVRGLCASASPLEEVRRLEDDAVGYSPEFWKQLTELDLIGLTL